MSFSLRPVILCGGSGTRLWPMSRESYPKQFIPLIEGKSLFQLTLERCGEISGTAGVIVIASEADRFTVRDIAAAVDIAVTILLEPHGRDTAAAIGLCAAYVDCSEVLLVMPADHYIPDEIEFSRTIHRGIKDAQRGSIITFGVKPSWPNTAYGYIKACQRVGDSYSVSSFVEKPDAITASNYVSEGNYFWNSGIFLAKASVWDHALQSHAFEIWTAVQKTASETYVDGVFVRFKSSYFKRCPKKSIDFAVIENHADVRMVPFESAWSDIGSWSALRKLSDCDSEGNQVLGQGWLVGTSNSYVRAEHRPVVVIGLDNLIVVDTKDALLVTASSHADQIKDVVSQMKSLGVPEALEHKKIVRPWGNFETIEEGPGFKVKRIAVDSHSSISLQLHNHRSEHWVVIRGTASIINGLQKLTIKTNESTFIPVGVKHRLSNDTDEPLEIIEIQSGDYLGEDDIIRFEDQYGRI
ncbi:mannose-1-phosphate guanylyltransferase/mannose-6-phosphate isomerase [Litorivicinus sp.]|nr:mannose-1-phosphate guanylyltransferase/mannose-6-phosphate isomerase [Litorivicinus sp.]MDC1239970.1 mannose-1-phosphate guanylyltransferase/mannose-6-phosphate isomerase [Litorivicinus sp.]